MNKKDISNNFSHFFHGGDYNPEQWYKMDGIIDEDFRLMKLAGVNTVSLGVFAWSHIEPKENEFHFELYDEIMNRLNKNGMKAILATPSGARPRWVAEKYPEVLRVNERRERRLFGTRANHCYTSPAYRERVRIINEKIAEHFADHPALVAWHISNEYTGECHCPLCQKAFREWLKKKYNNDLDLLNYEYWNTFWSHEYTSWEQIESPSPIGENSIDALYVDWRRFVSDQTIDFMVKEIEAVKKYTPDIPVTHNTMGMYNVINYRKLSRHLDVVGCDVYPAWHSPNGGHLNEAVKAGFVYDLTRTHKKRPFMLIETPPSVACFKVNMQKRPGVHMMGCMQAVAHGSDSVMYFQWRKCRGSSEKMHGAVIDHYGKENTRVFDEVSEVGKRLKKIEDVVGKNVTSEVAIIFDWDNKWTLDALRGMFNETGTQYTTENNDKKYPETCLQHYRPFWNRGINVDVIGTEDDFKKYKIVIAPMLHMTSQSVINKIKNYVEGGGFFVGTYSMGQVNENTLCYMNGFPAGELKDVFGIWAEELDNIYPEYSNCVEYEGNKYTASEYCEVIHPTSSNVIATYEQDYYKGKPAATVNIYGKGKAFYIAFRDDGRFVDALYESLIKKLNITLNVNGTLPEGVSAHTRMDGEKNYLFIENYNEYDVSVNVNGNDNYIDMDTGLKITNNVHMKPYSVKVLKK